MLQEPRAPVAESADDEVAFSDDEQVGFGNTEQQPATLELFRKCLNSHVGRGFCILRLRMPPVL